MRIFDMKRLLCAVAIFAGLASAASAQTTPAQLQTSINGIDWNQTTGQVSTLQVEGLFNQVVGIFENALPTGVFGSGVANLLSGAATGTGGPVGSISPTLTGTLTAATANFSGNLTAANLPPFALNINSTFNGINYSGCAASVSCTFYINGAPALGGPFGANPTVRIDRSPTGTGGISGDDTFAFEAVLNAPATDSWTENTGFFILNNRSVAANGTQSSALLVQAFKLGVADVGSTFGAAIASWDSTGIANPTQGLQGLEIDLAFGVPGAEVNAGADPNVTRQILKLVCSGLPNTHCGLGEAISTFFAGDVIDTGICFGSGCPGGNGTFAVGINMTGTYSKAAILFSALSQDGISWTNTSGVYNPPSAGAQIFSDTSNNLDIANYNGTAINFFTSSGVATATMTSAGLAETGSVLSSSPSGGVGYQTGAGGTVTQATSKATGVTLNKTTGSITMNGAALAAGATVSFVLTDTSIAATDVISVNHISGGTQGSYSIAPAAAAGSATIFVRNNSAGSLSEAIVIEFVVIKGVTASLEPANDNAHLRMAA